MIPVTFSNESAQLIIDLLNHQKQQSEKMGSVVDEALDAIKEAHKEATTNG